VILEPGQVREFNVSLVKSAPIPRGQATGELKISAVPSRAVVFVDNQYAGHVDEFDGAGKAMLLTPGRNAIRALRAMPPEVRERQLNSGRYDNFSPEERELLNHASQPPPVLPQPVPGSFRAPCS
jgi:hypothetical protein